MCFREAVNEGCSCWLCWVDVFSLFMCYESFTFELNDERDEVVHDLFVVVSVLWCVDVRLVEVLVDFVDVVLCVHDYNRATFVSSFDCDVVILFERFECVEFV